MFWSSVVRKSENKNDFLTIYSLRRLLKKKDGTNGIKTSIKTDVELTDFPTKKKLV